MSSSGGGGTMSDRDRRLCLDTVNVLTSKDLAKKNFLFLAPVDTSHFPTYRDFVKRPMDLGTLRANLESGRRYATRAQFFDDAALCFENAVAFNEGEPDRVWIVKLARSMMRILGRERAKADKIAGGGTADSSSSSGGAVKKKKKGSKSKKSEGARGGGGGGSGSGGSEKKKPSLKLNLSAGGGGGGEDGGSTKAKKKRRKSSSSPTPDGGGGGRMSPVPEVSGSASPKPSLSLKLKPSTATSEGSRSASPKPSLSLKLKPPSAKPSLSLKLKPPSASKSGAVGDTSASSSSGKPTVSLKLKPPSSAASAAGGTSGDAGGGKPTKKSKKDKKEAGSKKITAVKAKPSQPKFKLKLSLGKKKTASAAPPSAPASAAAVAAAASPKADDKASGSANKQTSASKPPGAKLKLSLGKKKAAAAAAAPPSTPSSTAAITAAASPKADDKASGSANKQTSAPKPPGSKLKLSLGKKKTAAAAPPSAPASTAAGAAAASPKADDKASASASANKQTSASKPPGSKLKLSLGKKKTAAAAPPSAPSSTAAAAAAASPKADDKASAAANKQTSVPKPPGSKLKLSLGKKKTVAAGPPSAPASAAAGAAAASPKADDKASASANKQTSAPKPTGSIGGSSRGKELPKGVQESPKAADKKAKAKADSKADKPSGRDVGGGSGGGGGGKPGGPPKLKLSLSGPSRGKELPQGAKSDDASSAGKGGAGGGGGKGSGGKGSGGAKSGSKSPKGSTSGKGGQKLTIALGGSGSSKGGSAGGGGGKPGGGGTAAKSAYSPGRKAVAAAKAKAASTAAAATATIAAKPPGATTISIPKSAAASAQPGRGGDGGGPNAVMTPARSAQCHKVLSALRRRNLADDTKWFVKPVTATGDMSIARDYKSKIPHPMDLGTLGNKLDKGDYKSVADFVLDLRRVFSNCLRYNHTINDDFRRVARDMLSSTEGILALFVANPEASAGGLPLFPPLLYCWKLCLQILNTLLNMKNPGDGHQTVHYFLHPVSYFFGGQLPNEYLAKVKTPMDFGTVTSRLFEGDYQSVGAFVADCRLIVENCRSYYGDMPDGTVFVEQAGRLHENMAQQMGALIRYDQSPAAAAAKIAPAAPIRITRPTRAFMTSMMTELRASKYTDKYTKLTESAALAFEKPVNSAFFQDYLQFVETPMDLETMDRKILGNLYETPEDFEYDMTLIFRNCEKYNVPKRNDHIVALAKHCSKVFRKIFSKRMNALQEGRIAESEGARPPSSVSSSSEKKDGASGGKRTASFPAGDGASSKPAKKARLDSGASTSTKSSGKASGRKSITSLPGSGAAATGGGGGAKEKSTKGRKSPKPSGSSKRSTPAARIRRPDEPVPLHVAIAQIKESFPVRRQYKMLESWEGACSRCFRELMRHQWISAAKPKFIFHVPVPVLFPAIKDEYEKKIMNPMDLTTVECKLLSGGIYTNPKNFVDDIALVFANAITFNRAGHDEGEPLSCAYFDASRHLLRYTRWLSLEYLNPYLTDSDESDPPTDEGLVTTWALTKGNKTLAREEMNEIAMRKGIEKSEEGDRYTWMEEQCEKLLKSLRHQSDLKYMHFFIQPNYPADYTAFISKPMDWERVQQTLQSRSYDTIGEVVDDLRLIFSNALKYNARAQDTDTVSGRAYDAALFMSTKLEVAVDKVLISVSERVEREKIDRLTAERELEAAERAEEERLRTAWQKEREQNRNTVEVKTRVETVETVRVVQPRKNHRRREMDFDMPFFEEDDGHHEQSQMETLRQQKLVFEKQQKDRLMMQKMTFDLGIRVYSRMAQRAQAMAWAKKVAAKKVAEKELALKESAEHDGAGSSNRVDAGTIVAPKPSNVSFEISKEGREQVKLCIGKPKKTKRRKKRALPDDF